MIIDLKHLKMIMDLKHLKMMPYFLVILLNLIISFLKILEFIITQVSKTLNLMVMVLTLFKKKLYAFKRKL